MKKILLLVSIILPLALNAQQVPLSENYFNDKYSLSPSYAGNHNERYLFLGYRSDWSGIDGGPKTMRLSFNDYLRPLENVGLGGKVIYDKAGIFTQLYVLSSYSYDVKINADNHLLFGLSAGIYDNSISLTDFYNDPNYTIDPSLISSDVNSKIKFMSDISAVWIWKRLEAGFLFSNIAFGEANYKGVNLKYNPVANFQAHLSYNHELNKDWIISPLMILRGEEYVRSQFELATQVMYGGMFRGSLVYRDPGILGFGAGALIGKGIILGYNFNFATNVVMAAFNNHELTVGINIFNYTGKTK